MLVPNRDCPAELGKGWGTRDGFKVLMLGIPTQPKGNRVWYQQTLQSLFIDSGAGCTGRWAWMLVTPLPGDCLPSFVSQANFRNLYGQESKVRHAQAQLTDTLQWVDESMCPVLPTGGDFAKCVCGTL